MKKFNNIMWCVYWAMFAIVTIGTVLYVTVDKARTWINKRIVVPYVKTCEKIGEEIGNMCWEDQE